MLRAAARLRSLAPGLPLRAPPLRLQSPPPLVLAVIIVAAAVAFVAGLTYYGAQQFSGDAADTRASNEAMSFAQHSSRLATGDAFDGYIQILRYADDPILNAKSSSATERAQAMQRLLYININKFTSLTLADRAGLIFATTDSTISNVRPSTAFVESRANLAPANTDVILPAAGRHGYVEYSAPLRDPDGTIWGILLGRTDPATLWHATLAAAVDGSRNVIINSEGLYAAGVPDELLRQPWHGRPLDNGGVRADIAGVDSICGLAPIGKDTQIDRGLNVASCLPASLIQIERNAATGKQAWITIAGAVLAIVLAATLFKLLLPGGTATRAATTAPPPDINEPAALPSLALATRLPDAMRTEAESGGIRPAEFGEPDDAIESLSIAEDARADDADLAPLAAEAADEDGAAASDAPPDALVDAPPPPPPPDVDALKLIQSYEQRNAGIAQRLRESVQARLLVAATEADAAFKLTETDTEAASTMHQHAMAEIEDVRVRELRDIGQEVYPGLTRLGLPGALRAMRKSIESSIKLTLDVDATADAVGSGAGRASVSPAIRIVFYRFALESIRRLASAGVEACRVSLRRVDGTLTISVTCHDAREPGELIASEALAPSKLAVEAYRGALVVTHADGVVAFTLDVPAPGVAPGLAVLPDEDWPAGEQEPDVPEDAALDHDPLLADTATSQDDEAADADPGDGAEEPRALPAVASGVTLEPRTGLAAAIEALQTEFFGSMIVALDLAADIDAGLNATQTAETSAIESVVRETLRALQAAESRQCDVSIRRSGTQVMLTILSEIGDAPFDATHITAWAPALEAHGGYLEVAERSGSVGVSAELAYASAGEAGASAALEEAAPDSGHVSADAA